MAERGEGSSSVSINVQELEKSMESLLTVGQRPRKKEPSTIYRAFHAVRKEHEQDYTPQIIAVGQFHHDDDVPKAMEPLKWRHLRQLINRSRGKNTLQNYINVIGEHVAEARSYYSEQVELDDDKFVKMMVLDGGFLIEFLVNAYTGKHREYLTEVKWNLPLFRRDLLLLENQFPFPILQLLFDSSDIPQLERNDGRRPATLTELAVTYITRNKLEKLPEGSSASGAIHHLLHVYHASTHPTLQVEDQQPAPRSCGKLKWLGSLFSALFFWLGSCFLSCSLPPDCCGSCRRRRSGEEKPRAPRGIPSATQLKASGIKFRERKGAGSFLDVRFDKDAGVMEIPKLSIQETTISLYRNLVAFEQCCPRLGSRFTSHFVLMDNLVDTPTDVAILKDAQIIESKLGEDKEVAELFNSLSKGTYLDYEEHHLHQLFKDVVAYSNIVRHKWRAGLMHNHFSNPWAFISFLAAFLLLLLTMFQAGYAITAYHLPPKERT